MSKTESRDRGMEEKEKVQQANGIYRKSEFERAARKIPSPCSEHHKTQEQMTASQPSPCFGAVVHIEKYDITMKFRTKDRKRTSKNVQKPFNST